MREAVFSSFCLIITTDIGQYRLYFSDKRGNKRGAVISQTGSFARVNSSVSTL